MDPPRVGTLSPAECCRSVGRWWWTMIVEWQQRTRLAFSEAPDEPTARLGVVEGRPHLLRLRGHRPQGPRPNLRPRAAPGERRHARRDGLRRTKDSPSTARSQRRRRSPGEVEPSPRMRFLRVDVSDDDGGALPYVPRRWTSASRSAGMSVSSWRPLRTRLGGELCHRRAVRRWSDRAAVLESTSDHCPQVLTCRGSKGLLPRDCRGSQSPRRWLPSAAVRAGTRKRGRTCGSSAPRSLSCALVAASGGARGRADRACWRSASWWCGASREKSPAQDP